MDGASKWEEKLALHFCVNLRCYRHCGLAHGLSVVAFHALPPTAFLRWSPEWSPGV